MADAILSCWIKLRAEEALMAQHFPDSYPDNCTRTKRLLPFIL